MPFIFILALSCIAVIVTLFVSRKLSPIPYFPSNKKDLKGIVESLQLTNNQVVYDLGAGDGMVIFKAALEAQRKKLNTRFIAIEINPILLMIIWVRHLFHPNRKNIQILRADIFNIRYRVYGIRYTFFTYISPWYLEKVFANIQYQISDFRFVSYFYPLPNLKSSRTMKGVHNTYIYNV